MTAARTPLPTGTIALLFTDIEGSTRIVQAIGTERWTEVLLRHREIVREVLARHGGREVQTEGDSFFAVFESPAGAVVAAAEAQRALAAERWPDDAPIRVRMGLHFGEAVLDPDGKYVGADIHRAARISGVANGGQVVISSTLAAAVAESLPPGVRLRDLREHRLKDLRPERLYDVVVDGLPSDFPPIRSLDARPNNLPTQLTSFVGRERELAEVRRLLRDSRLLTLTGPGGTGKTRLSLQLAAESAEDFAGGVYFVALAPIRDADLVPTTIARAIGLLEDPARPTLEVLADELAGKRILLVLDNLEQVLEAATRIAELLRRLPDLSIVATSRAALRVSGEQEYPVPGLPVPLDETRLSPLERAELAGRPLAADPAALAGYESIRLFVARAKAVRPDFELTPENAAHVAAICARLDGMPLAIELAAARVRVLSPESILSRLGRQLDLLAAGARDLPERQRTLRGAIAWSDEILDEPCRRLFQRMSVFAGGGRLVEIEPVCGTVEELGQDVLDGLTSLVDQSLIRVEEDTDTRYLMLEPIREFAAERLDERDDPTTVRSRHAETYAALVERAAPELHGRDQRRWLDLLEREHDNIRAALDWALAYPSPAVAMTIAARAWRFWQKRGHLREARRRIRAVLDAPWSSDDPAARALLLEAAGGVEYWHGAMDSAMAYYDEALAIARTLDDPAMTANALYNAATSRYVGGRTSSEALPMLEEALELARRAGDRHGEANVLWGIGTYHYFEGDNATSLPFSEQALAMFPETGDITMEAWAAHNAGISLIKLGRYDEAVSLLGSALRLFREVGDLSGVTLGLDDYSAIAAGRGDLPRAARLTGAARGLGATSGADLARLIEEQFEQLTRPSAATMLAPDELQRYAAEGAAMTLDEAVEYALADQAGGDVGTEPTAR